MTDPQIRRFNGFADPRFSPNALRQHGCFLVEGEPYEVTITGDETGVLRGGNPAYFPLVLEEYRFYTPHIIRFFAENGQLLAEFPRPERLRVPLERIQPSQFYVDREKVRALEGFIRREEDIVIQLLRTEEDFIALDGHTRLYIAVHRQFQAVYGVEAETDDFIFGFVAEGKRRGIRTPGDLTILDHDEYVEKWDRYCDAFFAAVSD